MSDEPEPKKKEGLFDDFFSKEAKDIIDSIDPIGTEQKKLLDKVPVGVDTYNRLKTDESQLPMSDEEIEGYNQYREGKIIEEEMEKDKAMEKAIQEIEEKPKKPPIYLQTAQKLDYIIEVLKRNQNKGELVPLYVIEEYLLNISQRTSASRNRKETNATRQIGETKFRFKDLKNVYKLIEILLENNMLFRLVE
jgi:hypothetical protein